MAHLNYPEAWVVSTQAELVAPVRGERPFGIVTP